MNTINIPLDPNGRAREGCKGRPVQLGERGKWLFPYHVYSKAFDTFRDHIHYGMITLGTVATGAIIVPALMLLHANYDLEEEEAKTLLMPPTKRDVLEEAVIACLIGEDDPTQSYSNWVRSALEANRSALEAYGLVPDSISAEVLPIALSYLEATRRIIPIRRHQIPGPGLHDN